MNYSQKNLLEILEVSRKAFEHTLEKPEVIEKVKNYGFDAERLKAGMESNRKADELYRGKRTATGQKASKYLNVSSQMKKSYDSFIMDRRILKRAYRNEPEILNELLLNIPVPDPFFDRIKFMKAFFEICQRKENLLAKVSRYGLSSEKIAESLEKITKIEKDAIDKSTLMMEDEKATQDRNRAFEDLNQEWQVYKNILIAVFGPDNQALEEFGIIVPSKGLFKKIRKKKAAPADNAENPDANDNKNNPGNPTTPAPAIDPEKKADTTASYR
jgi:hypothetical protein